MPLYAQSAYFEEMVHTELQNSLFDLVAQFGRVTGMTLAQLPRGNRPNGGLANFQLPPLAFLVFRAIDRIDQLPEATLEQRHRFQKLRIELRGLVELWRDPDRSDGAKLIELKKWKDAWRKAEADPLGWKSYRFRVGSTALLKTISTCSGLVAGTPDAATSFLGFAPNVLEAVASAYERMGPKTLLMRPVYDTFSEYMASNHAERVNIVRNVVGRQMEHARRLAGQRSRYGHFGAVSRDASDANIYAGRPQRQR